MMTHLRSVFLFYVFSMVASLAAAAEQAITDISFNAQPSGQLSIALEFDDREPPEFSSYTIEDPARIVIDFPETENQLSQRRYALPEGNASSVVVVEAGDRSRLIVNLSQLGEFDAKVEGQQFVLTVGAASAESYTAPSRAGARSAKTSVYSSAGAENPAMARMQQVMPLIAGIMTPIISKYGFANVMQAVMVVNMTVNQPGADPALKEATAAIQGAAMGNIPDDATCQALLAKLA